MTLRFPVRPLSSLVAAAAIAALACSSGSDPSGPSGGGKADEVGSSCDYSIETPLPETSLDLAEYVVHGRVVGKGDIAGLTLLEQEQLLVAVLHLDLAGNDLSLDNVFDATDDDEFELLDFEFEEDVFIPGQWVRFYAGDTEVGVIFADKTTDVIAEVSDGDIMGCPAPTPDEQLAACASLEDEVFALCVPNIEPIDWEVCFDLTATGNADTALDCCVMNPDFLYCEAFRPESAD